MELDTERDLGESLSAGRSGNRTRTALKKIQLGRSLDGAQRAPEPAAVCKRGLPTDGFQPRALLLLS